MLPAARRYELSIGGSAWRRASVPDVVVQALLLELLEALLRARPHLLRPEAVDDQPLDRLAEMWLCTSSSKRSSYTSISAHGVHRHAGVLGPELRDDRRVVVVERVRRRHRGGGGAGGGGEGARSAATRREQTCVACTSTRDAHSRFMSAAAATPQPPMSAKHRAFEILEPDDEYLAAGAGIVAEVMPCPPTSWATCEVPATVDAIVLVSSAVPRLQVRREARCGRAAASPIPLPPLKEGEPKLSALPGGGGRRPAAAHARRGMDLTARVCSKGSSCRASMHAGAGADPRYRPSADTRRERCGVELRFQSVWRSRPR